jgi:hypothetical protein
MATVQEGAPRAEDAARGRNRSRSVIAVATGFVAVIVLSLATDELLHVLHVYPPWGESMNEKMTICSPSPIGVSTGFSGAISPQGLRRTPRCATYGSARRSDSS